jgi:hypothetical protein
MCHQGAAHFSGRHLGAHGREEETPGWYRSLCKDDETLVSRTAAATHLPYECSGRWHREHQERYLAYCRRSGKVVVYFLQQRLGNHRELLMLPGLNFVELTPQILGFFSDLVQAPLDEGEIEGEGIVHVRTPSKLHAPG